MKKIMVVLLMILMISTGCRADVSAIGGSEKENGNENGKENEKVLSSYDLYNRFLKGEISASLTSDENSKMDINQLFSLDENYNKYTLFDANHNGVPELHLSSMRGYTILEDSGDTLTVIYSGSGYEKLLNNGALLYTRKGGAPEHVSYIYKELDIENNIAQVNFEKYNTDNESDDDDQYLFEGNEVSKSDFEEKTGSYLSMESDLILWSDYWTFLVENAN
ncbi:hypothetical protein [Fusibacter bizertensis]